MPSFNDTIVTMPFGKYKNSDVRVIPNSYLDWFYENCTNIDKDLREYVRKEIIRRAKEGIVIQSNDYYNDEGEEIVFPFDYDR